MAPPPPIPPGGGVLFCRCASGLGKKKPRRIGKRSFWRRTQVVRERSAKPLCIGSNPIVASNCCNTDGMTKGLVRRKRSKSPYPSKLGPESGSGIDYVLWNRSSGISGLNTTLYCRGGGIGRRTGLKILRAARPVPVQVRPSVRRRVRTGAVSSVG